MPAVPGAGLGPREQAAEKNIWSLPSQGFQSSGSKQVVTQQEHYDTPANALREKDWVLWESPLDWEVRGDLSEDVSRADTWKAKTSCPSQTERKSLCRGPGEGTDSYVLGAKVTPVARMQWARGKVQRHEAGGGRRKGTISRSPSAMRRIWDFTPGLVSFEQD